MERPIFMTDSHFNYLNEMTESKLFTKEEIKEQFIDTFPKLTTFKANKILKHFNNN